MKALISVYDKTGIVPLARSLADMGAELISTGGTYRSLTEGAGLQVVQVSDYTGSPRCWRDASRPCTQPSMGAS